MAPGNNREPRVRSGKKRERSSPPRKSERQPSNDSIGDQSECEHCVGPLISLVFRCELSPDAKDLISKYGHATRKVQRRAPSQQRIPTGSSTLEADSDSEESSFEFIMPRVRGKRNKKRLDSTVNLIQEGPVPSTRECKACLLTRAQMTSDSLNQLAAKAMGYFEETSRLSGKAVATCHETEILLKKAEMIAKETDILIKKVEEAQRQRFTATITRPVTNDLVTGGARPKEPGYANQQQESIKSEPNKLNEMTDDKRTAEYSTNTSDMVGRIDSEPIRPSSSEWHSDAKLEPALYGKWPKIKSTAGNALQKVVCSSPTATKPNPGSEFQQLDHKQDWGIKLRPVIIPLQESVKKKVLHDWGVKLRPVNEWVPKEARQKTPHVTKLKMENEKCGPNFKSMDVNQGLDEPQLLSMKALDEEETVSGKMEDWRDINLEISTTTGLKPIGPQLPKGHPRLCKKCNQNVQNRLELSIAPSPMKYPGNPLLDTSKDSETDSSCNSPPSSAVAAAKKLADRAIHPGRRWTIEMDAAKSPDGPDEDRFPATMLPAPRIVKSRSDTSGPWLSDSEVPLLVAIPEKNDATTTSPAKEVKPETTVDLDELKHCFSNAVVKPLQMAVEHIKKSVKPASHFGPEIKWRPHWPGKWAALEEVVEEQRETSTAASATDIESPTKAIKVIEPIHRSRLSTVAMAGSIPSLECSTQTTSALNACGTGTTSDKEDFVGSIFLDGWQMMMASEAKDTAPPEPRPTALPDEAEVDVGPVAGERRPSTLMDVMDRFRYLFGCRPPEEGPVAGVDTTNRSRASISSTEDDSSEDNDQWNGTRVSSSDEDDSDLGSFHPPPKKLDFFLLKARSNANHPHH